MGLVSTFFGVFASIWMLAVANKIVSDAWDVTIGHNYKLFLKKYYNHLTKRFK